MKQTFAIGIGGRGPDRVLPRLGGHFPTGFQAGGACHLNAYKRIPIHSFGRRPPPYLDDSIGHGEKGHYMW